jgi:hypothetical protein
MISVHSGTDKDPDRSEVWGPPIMMNDECVVGSVRLDVTILIEGSTLDSCYDIHM